MIPIPGASSLIVALSASGLPTERFTFHGFVPKKTAARHGMFATLEPGTHAFFCPARDLPLILSDLASIHDQTQVVVAREITKRHETWLRGSARDVADGLDDEASPRGEAVVLIHRPPRGDESVTDQQIVAALIPLVEGGMRSKEAASRIAAELGVSKRRVYQLTLQL